MLGTEKHPGSVDPNNAVPVLRGEIDYPNAASANTGVVHQYVDPAVVPDGVADNAGPGGFTRHVQRDVSRRATRVVYLPGHFGAAFVLYVSDDDARPFSSEEPGLGGAHATGSARNYCDLSRQSIHGGECMGDRTGCQRNLRPLIPTCRTSPSERECRYNSVPVSDQAPDLKDLSDEEILDLIAEQRRDALADLYRRYSTAAYSFAIKILRDPGGAEEVTQDAFFNVWRRAGSYKKGRGKVTAWLFSIVHHRAIDEIRRRNRREQQRSSREVETLDIPSDDSSDPVRFATAQFQRGVLDEALKTLRPEQRAVVELAYFGGLTHTEIAARLEQPLGTVKTRMRLALKKLRGTVSRDVMG